MNRAQVEPISAAAVPDQGDYKLSDHIQAETEPESEGLAARTVKSSAWVYARHVVSNAVNVVVMAVLARNLSPSDFGLAALAAILLRFLSIIGAAGIASYVIYDRAEGREERVHAAFWLQAALALGTSIVALAAVPFVSAFYGMRGLAEILLALIASYFIGQLTIVPDALIKRSLDFQKLAKRDTALEVSVGLLSVGMALSGSGVWSLVLPNLMMAPIRLGVVLYIGGWIPRLWLGVLHWGRISKYSVNAIFAELANAFIAEGDSLVIGKTLGSAALGVYNMAWTSANMVSRNVTGTIGKVATPALAAVAHDTARLQTAYTRMTRMLGLTSFPLLIGLFVLADVFVLALFGAQWTGAILPLRILIIFAMRRAVGSPATAIYDAVGRPDIGAKLGLVLLPFYIIGILVGSRWGIIGVTIAVTVVRTAFGMIGWKLSANCASLGFWDSLKPLAEPLTSSMLLGITVYALKLLLYSVYTPAMGHPVLSLLLLSGAGAFIYVVLLRTIYNNLAKEFVATVGPAVGPFRGTISRALGVA